MPLKKIRDLAPQDTCTSREHNPPSHMVYSPGVYEWTCPACGKKTTFTIRKALYGHYPASPYERPRWDTGHVLKGVVGAPTPTGLTQAAYDKHNDALLEGAARAIQTTKWMSAAS